MAIEAVLMDIEGVLGPQSFLDETLVPHARERLGAFIAEHGEEDEEIEEALDEAGRLMGGFSLKPREAEALLLRWMKQGRNPTPLKIIQGRIWQEGYAAGAFSAEVHGDAGPSLAAWKGQGLKLFTFSSSSELAQKLWLSSAGSDAERLLDGFFDTRMGQKMEEEAYKAIAQEIGLAPSQILVLSGNVDELDAAASAGLATVRIARDGGDSGRHPAAADLASVILP